MWRFGFADRADRPIGSDPLARGVSKNGREIDDAGRLIDRGGLYRGDLMLAKSLAHNIEPAGERRVAELPDTDLACLRSDRAGERLFWVRKFDLRLGQRRGERGNRGTRPLHGRPLRLGRSERPN